MYKQPTGCNFKALLKVFIDDNITLQMTQDFYIWEGFRAFVLRVGVNLTSDTLAGILNNMTMNTTAKQIEIVNLKKQDTHAIMRLRIFIVLKYQTGRMAKSDKGLLLLIFNIIYQVELIITAIDIQV